MGYSRQAFAMAREGYLPKFLAYTSEKNKTPIWAVIVPSIIGIAFVLTGATATIITISCFGAIILYIISMITVFMLRIKEPNLVRPFKVAYPVVPAIALSIAVIFLIAVGYANISTMIWVAATYLAASLFYLLYSKVNIRKEEKLPVRGPLLNSSVEWRNLESLKMGNWETGLEMRPYLLTNRLMDSKLRG